MRHRAGLALVLLVAVAAPAAAEATPVTFYGHVFGASLTAPMPANTQYPWGEEDWATGQTDTPCLQGVEDCDTKESNKLVLFSTAGPVNVKSQRQFSYEALHNERGLTQDVLLDPNGRITATLHLTPGAFHAWFHTPQETPCLETDPPENVPCLYPYWRWHPGASPDVVVKAWLVAAVLGERGDAAGERPPMGEAWRDGEAVVVAYGETEPVTTLHLDGYLDNPRVWRFDVDLGTPLVDHIENTNNLGLVFSWENAPSGVRFNTLSWRLNSGEFFPTSFVLPVLNPFTVELVHPTVVHGKLAILAVMNTPWGSYDVDPESIRLTVADARGREVEPERVRVVQDFSVAHGGHYRPVNVTYVWDHVADGLPPGTYTATVEAANYQGSARSSATARFDVLPNGALANVVPGRAGVQTFDEGDVDALVGRPEDRSGGGAEDGAPGLTLPLLLGGVVLLARRRRA